MHSTNSRHTFVTVAPDSTATRGTPPPERANPTVAFRTFRLIHDNPYRYTSDDVLFTVHADRAGIPDHERSEARERFFAKPQACMRASDLTRRYGWGVHHDGDGKVALYGVETEAYRQLASGRGLGPDPAPITVRAAMRSRRG